MRCNYCQRYMHKLHKSVIEHEDGSADVCDCPRCNPEMEDRLIGRTADFESVNEGSIPSPPAEGSPPTHPLPFDHGKYRVAEEPPGTDPRLSWQSTYCVECREQVWAKNQRTVEREEAVCETCYYMTVSEHYEEMAKKQKRIQMRWVNPFEL